MKTLSWQTRDREKIDDESKISLILDRMRVLLFLDRNSRQYRITILWQCRWFTTCVTLDFSTRCTRYVLSHIPVHRTPDIQQFRLNSSVVINPIIAPSVHLFPPFSIAHAQSRASMLSSMRRIHLNANVNVLFRDLSHRDFQARRV